jgi:hypothetical protein
MAFLAVGILTYVLYPAAVIYIAVSWAVIYLLAVGYKLIDGLVSDD